MKHHTPLTDAQRILVEENLGLISFAMNKLPKLNCYQEKQTWAVWVILFGFCAEAYWNR